MEICWGKNYQKLIENKIENLQQKFNNMRCDEAGRGFLIGPVFASAVVLPKKFFHPLLNDSKLINEKQDIN